ncbi:hypothetical protein PPTG_21086 [Phytophthora nicotianae INRA-310]|uniref:Uncharacterized protein n=1 Tax=Phytophthora nicotianae (strain INRA-310) TaxID=761204 RepID=W2R9V1_PHYN3|nr:hypothetical protein PPTG_21086 [Phytophthora nicotianae INRA-310]ETN21484.1 hypothetical protein PPTG_21086 [Phytophthora nicotianae INRA-310]
MLIPSPLAKMDKRRLGRLQLPVVLSEDGHLREDDAVAMAVHESLSFTALENDDNPVCQSAASKPHKRLAIFATLELSVNKMETSFSRVARSRTSDGYIPLNYTELAKPGYIHMPHM